MLAAGFCVSLAACNNSSETSANADSTNVTSSGNYAARADSVKANVAAGHYINPRTNKPYTTLTVNPNTGELTDESGNIVRRYIDNRTWWVYDANSWDTVGTARMMGDTIQYYDNGNWTNYDTRWSDDMALPPVDTTQSNIAPTTDANGKVKSKGDELKIKNGDDKTKLKKGELKDKPADQQKTKVE